MVELYEVEFVVDFECFVVVGVCSGFCGIFGVGLVFLGDC